MPTARRVADVIADGLVAAGVTHIFGVPGESYLDLLDALFERREEIAFITTRHEAAAANMAEATAKLTGVIGVAAVTRGPGATHAAIGVHTARQDSTPMLLLVGQVPTAHRGREAFQEIDYAVMFGAVAKGVVSIEDAQTAEACLAEAIALAYAGRPGPVVVVLPEDVLGLPVAAVVAHATPMPVRAKPAVADVAALVERLAVARRPLILVGGPLWSDSGSALLREFAEHQRIPVAAVFRRQDRLSNDSPAYAGDAGLGINPALKARIAEADLLIALGTRLGEIATQAYSLPVPQGREGQTLVHIHVDAAELGRVYRNALLIHAHPGECLAALRDLSTASVGERQEWYDAARIDYLRWVAPIPNPGALQLADLYAWLRNHLPADAIVANGAGNYAAWLHRFYRYRRLHTQLAPTSGAMGYGLPAALAAKLHYPERTVVAIAGDGCFQMALPELATAMQYGIAVIVLVFNNSRLGTIRMHQEREFPQRTIATEFPSLNFAQIAAAYGAHAERVSATNEFPAAFARAEGAGRCALIEIIVPPEVLSPTMFLRD